MNASKRLATLLLTFCLVLSMVVPPVYAVGTDITPVEGTVSCKDAVKSVNCLLAASDEIEEQDYVYLFFNGGMMYVYNLDTGKLVNKVSNCFGTPRSVYIDEKHIVWATGANGALYRYDPETQGGEMISMTAGLFPEITTSFNGYGLTGDGKGNLYFGTYPVAYLGKYDTNTGEFSRLGGTLSDDATRSGQGGMVYKDGYLYFEIEGNLNGDATSVNQIVKFELKTNAVVDYVDIISPMKSNDYLDEIALVGDLLLCSSAKPTAGSIAIDISGEKMELISDISGLTTGFNGAVSPEVDGKVYMMSNNGKGLLEYNITEKTVTAENIMSDKGALKFRDCFVTLESNDQMPGNSLVTFVNGANQVDLVLYNLQTKNTVVLEDVTEGQGSGNQLRALETINDGKTILISSYGWNHMSVYDVASGEVKVQYPTINTQIESIIYYEGEVYIGNYSSCTVSRIDVETGEYVRLVQLSDSVFSQHRLHATAAGDRKVFFGSAPAKYRLGGVLIWYDVESDRCYVAAGPNPEDVFYTPSGASKGGETGNVSDQQWYSALTGDPAFTDDDDSYIDGEQRFYGPIEKQTINSLVYQDGYIYGSTSRAGGSQSKNTGVGNACIFVYDVKAMEVVATCDLTEEIDGLKTPVEFIDGIAADPDVPGKIWGIVSDTLFSFTYDTEKGISVTTELSKGTTAYNHGNNLHQDRSIVMDGDFMYVAFGSYGTYMIKRDDPQVHYKLSDAVPKQMVLAGDGNLYYHDGTVDLKVLRIAETAQMVKDTHGLAKTQELIDALDAADKITLEDEAAVLAARKEYNKLSDEAKNQVNTEKLTAAETALQPLQQAAADTVIAKITAIGEVTLEREAAVKEARAAYDALSDNLKTMITNAAELIAAEEALAYLQNPAAAEVYGMIDAIGTVDLNSGPAIERARTAYDKLTDDQKAVVKNLNVLTAAEATYKKVVAVQEKIDAIGTVTLESEAAINTARTAYDALTKEQKKVVDSAALIDAEKDLAAQKKFHAEYSMSTNDHGISGGNGLSNQNLIDALNNAYADPNGTLNWNFKDITSNTDSLNMFVNHEYLLCRSFAVDDWIALTIDGPGAGTWKLTVTNHACYRGAKKVNVYLIPGNTTNIASALTAEYLVGYYSCYDKDNETDLPTSTSGGMNVKTTEFTNLWTSGDDETYILVLQVAEEGPKKAYVYLSALSLTSEDTDVPAVEKTIADIGKVTLESREAIEAARAAYDALCNRQKAQVTNYSVLTAAEESLAELQAAAKEVAGTAMTLGNSLSMDFVVASANVEDSYYAKITRDNTTVTVPRSEWKTYDQHGDYLYFSYTGIAAKEMCEEVTVNIYDSQGNQVFKTYTDSIQAHAMRMLERGDVLADPEWRTLYVDMLNYGAEAQKYWNYNTENLANEKLTETQKSYATTSVSTENKQITDTGYVGAALTLENQILLDFGFTFEDYTGLTAVATYTDHYGNHKQVEFSESHFKSFTDGRYLSISGLAVADWQQVVTCTVYKGHEEVATVSDSVESYVARQTENMTLTTLVDAIAKFGQSAHAYFH